MKRLLPMFAILLSILVGCTEDKPRPKGIVDQIIPVQVNEVSDDVVAVASQNPKATFDINYHTREQNVYVECFIPGFQLKKGEGHLNVTVDGQKTKEIYTAAFILKGLEKGEHNIVVEVVHNDQNVKNLKKTLNVKVQ
ncbi:hypothetical protein FS935_06765 [Metabacillus litoralis]|uniref:Lipoprotein n=1 Tax=Metabacillus litoralis TaxID=152268 RepID=A0A5C6W6K0_9BACI|nr:hypothetical protein [Metabacillus litoralis]TXC92077.1 hypothetical protein FS935_06765 [Metabacillus litoralis]